jgi:hypothetical protein
LFVIPRPVAKSRPPITFVAAPSPSRYRNRLEEVTDCCFV